MNTGRITVAGKSRGEAPARPPATAAASPRPPAHNPLWERLALNGPARPALGGARDPEEREADRIADRVLGSPVPEPGPTAGGACSRCAETARLQRKPSSPSEASGSVPAQWGPGEPLSDPVRTFFEPRLDADLSGVRVHRSPAAAAAADRANAQAFALGNRIVFGAGEYRPEGARGRRLLAHELAHTLQQGASDGLTLRRTPRDREDPIHQPIIEQYRREEGLPESGIDPLSGRPVGPSPARIKYGPWPGDVAAPASAPSLAAVPEALPIASCGTVTPGMDPTAREAIVSCIVHARFVNHMSQSIANIAQVASPYAPGIASAYRLALAQVVQAGTAGGPAAGASTTFRVNPFTVTVSQGSTLPIAGFELILMRQPNGPNGASLGGGIELNEESQAAWLNDQPDIERTMYHEAFHWLSGEVSAHNRQVRQSGTGTIVRRELDAELVRPFEAELRAAAEPIWADILAQVPLQPGSSLRLTPAALSGIQWIKISNEILSRVEEAIYLNLRQGQGFSRRFDLPNLRQDWLLTSDYWDSGVIFVRADLQAFIAANAGRVNRELLPVVQKIQREYLRRRPAS